MHETVGNFPGRRGFFLSGEQAEGDGARPRGQGGGELGEAQLGQLYRWLAMAFRRECDRTTRRFAVPTPTRQRPHRLDHRLSPACHRWWWRVPDWPTSLRFRAPPLAAAISAR